ncbi:MAG: SGNH/GDSL hydrolase family protein [Caulobacteraceae bacterium]
MGRWLVLVGLLSLAGAVPVAAAAGPVAGTYVALGSSYAAGTSLPRLADDSPTGCGQGTENYPRQVARALKLKLVDRSCGGATTGHILQGGQFGQPAQIAAVGEDTGLVTVTIGGNDVRFTADLGRFSCLNQAGQGAPCGDAPADFDLDHAFITLDANLRAMTAEIRRRAPRARIVLVDYVTVTPPAGTCPRIALSAEEAGLLRARAARLAALTSKVAKDAGAVLIEASKLTQGHHACSANPWVRGYLPAVERGTSNAVPFHPRPEAIAAVAKAIVVRLQR